MRVILICDCKYLGHRNYPGLGKVAIVGSPLGSLTSPTMGNGLSLLYQSSVPHIEQALSPNC